MKQHPATTGGTSGPLPNTDLDMLWLAIVQGRRSDALDYLKRLHPKHNFMPIDAINRIYR